MRGGTTEQEKWQKTDGKTLKHVLHFLQAKASFWINNLLNEF
jgi:hypothetical protein